MKINCDYCGALIDTDKYRTCPNCGGAYGNDHEVIKEKEKLDRADDLYFQKKELENDRMRIENKNLMTNSAANSKTVQNAAKFMSLGCLMPIITICITFVIIIVFAVMAVASERKTGSSSSKKAKETTTHSSISIEPIEMPDISIPEIPEITVPQIETKVTAGLGEPAQTLTYSVTCDRYQPVDRWPYKPSEGYDYVSFHIIIENTGKEEYSPEEKIMCLVDGIMCDSQRDSDRKQLSSDPIPSGIKADGNICFEVPVDAEYFDIKYGDYVTLHLKNTLTAETTGEEAVSETE